MKNRKIRAKEGMTLIEVIISVALLSILIVPLSGIVMSSLKNNVSAEYRQKASYVGQKLLEELKAYDEINLKGEAEKYFELLDGDKIIQGLEGNFVGIFDRTIYGSPSNRNEKDIYKVDVEIERDSNFQYEDINDLDKNNNAGFRLNFTSNNMINDSYVILDKLIMEIDKDSNNLVVYNESNFNNKLTINKTSTNNNIVLFIEENFSKDVNIEFKNKTEETVEIHMIREKNNSSKIKIYSSAGDVILYEENAVEENKIGDMYNYTVIVKDKKNNILFQGSSSKNVNIK